MPLKYIMCFLSGINTKKFWNIPEEKYSAPLRIVYPFIKFLVSSFADIGSTFFIVRFIPFQQVHVLFYLK